MRNTFLVCYDISNDKRRHRVHKALRGFGDHLQYSVFECQLTRADLARCRHILSEAIHHREDQVLFVDLGPVEGRGDRVISALGRAYSPLDSPCFVIERDDDPAPPAGPLRTLQALQRAREARALEGLEGLALDLMEGFRPLIVDSAVITAINTRMVTRDDFIRVGPSVALTPKGRKRFITAYEQRMDALVTHPLFGYRVNYRRVLEIQARLLARVVTGELARYPGFETR